MNKYKKLLKNYLIIVLDKNKFIINNILINLLFYLYYLLIIIF